MSNVAFDLEVLKQIAAAIPVPGPATSLPFAALGAIGPDLYQYVPVSSKLSDGLHDAVQKAIAGLTPSQVSSGTPPLVDLSAIKADATLAAELFEKPLMAAYCVLFREVVVVFWPIFQTDVDLLNQLQTAANNQDGEALKSLSSQLDQLGADSKTLQSLVPTILTIVGLLLELAAFPPSIEATGAGAKPWLPEFDRLFEFLRWRHTDVFAQNLLAGATTDNQRAYAYGYLTHVAASVTGKPFINNIVGGPYRTHWWRNRLVSNWVDAWTYGRYETPATMAGDEPTPAYASWKNICTANLQDQFNVANLSEPAGQLPEAVSAIATGNLGTLPAQFPADIAAYIQAAIDATYPAIVRPPGFATDTINEAFVGLFGVVWFMTSGFGPMTPFALGAAPTSCTSPPSWVTSGGSPPSPTTSGPSTGATVCGVVLAILALFFFIFGAFTGGSTFGAGVDAVIGAVKAFTSGGGIDWDNLQCDLFWLRSLVLQAETGLVKGLVEAGLAYPDPSRLGTQDTNGLTHPAVDLTPNGGVPLTKSNGGVGPAGVAVDDLYPRQLDATNLGFADLDFGSFPTSAVETPATMNFPLNPHYADSVIDGSGLNNGGMLPNGPFPSRNQFFGGAVANAQQLITAVAKGLPRYNLDADRGYGWKTWNPKVNTFPGNGTVDAPTPNV
jgi:hypothetical protein